MADGSGDAPAREGAGVANASGLERHGSRQKRRWEASPAPPPSSVSGATAGDVAAGGAPDDAAGADGADEHDAAADTGYLPKVAERAGSGSGTDNPISATSDGDAAAASKSHPQSVAMTPQQRQALELALGGVRTRARQFEVLAGAASVEDPPWVFFRKMLWHHVQLVGLALLMAVVMAPIVWYHSLMHVLFLDEWEAALGVGATNPGNCTGLLAPEPSMMDPGKGLFWLWATTFSVFGTTNLLCVSVVWLYIVGGYHRLPKWVEWLTVLITVVFFAYIYGGYLLIGVAEWKIPQWAYNLIPFASAAAFAFIAGYLMRERLRFPACGKVMGLQVLANTVVFYLYVEIIPRAFLTAESEWTRLIIRLVIHPLLVEVILGTMRLAALYYPPHLDQSTLVVFLFPTYVSSNLLGRFLVAASSSIEISLAMSLVMAAQELAMRFTVPQRTYWYIRLLGHTDVSARDVVASKRARRLKADALSMDMLCEIFGIIIAPFFITFYGMTSRGDPIPTVSDLTVSAVVQLIIEVFTDLLPAFMVLFWGRRRIRRRKQAKADAANGALGATAAAGGTGIRAARFGGGRTRVGPAPAVATPAGPIDGGDGDDGAVASTVSAADLERGDSTGDDSVFLDEDDRARQTQADVSTLADLKKALAAERASAAHADAGDDGVSTSNGAGGGVGAGGRVPQFRGGVATKVSTVAPGGTPFGRGGPTYGFTSRREAASDTLQLSKVSQKQLRQALANTHTALEATEMILRSGLLNESMRSVDTPDELAATLLTPPPETLPHSEDSTRAAGAVAGASSGYLSTPTSAASASPPSAAAAAGITVTPARVSPAAKVNRSRWVVATRRDVDGHLEVHASISEIQEERKLSAAETIAVVQGVLKLLHHARASDFAESIKRDQVTFVNAFEHRFDYWVPTVMFYFLSWVEYFNRFFLFCGIVLTGVRQADGSWSFQPC